MRKFSANIFETVLAFLTLLSLIGLAFYFSELTSVSNQVNPFDSFNRNSGIITISIISLIARILFLTAFLFLAVERFRNHKSFKIIYLSTALLIGFLQWYELYYGSTFYYGEVRDKQGLMFPLLASFMVTLIIWKIDYSKAENSNLSVKLLLTGLINVGLYLFWGSVYEVWNLGQS